MKGESKQKNAQVEYIADLISVHMTAHACHAFHEV